MSETGTLLAVFHSLIFYGKIRPDFVSEHIFLGFIFVYSLKLKEKIRVKYQVFSGVM